MIRTLYACLPWSEAICGQSTEGRENDGIFGIQLSTESLRE